jgi:lactate/malate dehydrogenase, NAD binding domain
VTLIDLMENKYEGRIYGAGAVGSACLLSMVMRGSAREVVLVNRDRKRAQGVVTDVQYGAVLSPPIAVRDGDYSDLVSRCLRHLKLARGDDMQWKQIECGRLNKYGLIT